MGAAGLEAAHHGERAVPPLVVYFDGSCPLCRAEIGGYSRCRGAETIEFVDVSRPGALAGCEIDQRTAMQRFHVRRRDGRLVCGAAAFTALWRELPGWRPLAGLAELPGMPWLLERLYRGFLGLRRRWQRGGAGGSS